MDIGELELKVKSESQSAASGIEELSKSLEKLKVSVKGAIGLNSIADGIGKISKSLDGISSSHADKIRNISSALVSLKSQMDPSSFGKLTGIESLGKSLSDLKSATKGGLGLKKISEDLAGLSAVADSITTDQVVMISDMSDALVNLKSIKSTGLTSTINSLKKLPETMQELEKIDMKKLSTKLTEVATAMEPLAKQMDRVALGFSAFPTKLQWYMSAVNGVGSANRKVGGSFLGMSLKIGVAYGFLRQGLGYVADWITESNKYVENLNLFNASLGRFSKSAKRYAESVSEIMGIDPGEWMRNQGIFQTLATGFGVIDDRAYIMSKNLTQLGYDLSSYFNVSVEDAMQKLQSGLAGELEPLNLAA